MDVENCAACVEKRTNLATETIQWCVVGTSDIFLFCEDFTPTFSFVDSPKKWYGCIDAADSSKFPAECTGKLVPLTDSTYVSGISKKVKHSRFVKFLLWLFASVAP